MKLTKSLNHLTLRDVYDLANDNTEIVIEVNDGVVEEVLYSEEVV